MDAHRVAIAPDPFARSNVAPGYTVGGLTFLSSVGPVDADGGLVGTGDFDAQAEQAFRNLEALLAAAGSGLEIMAGGGVRVDDISALAAAGVHAVHLSARGQAGRGGPSGPGGGVDGFDETDVSIVEAAVAAADWAR